MKNAPIGWFGLGQMGGPMAARLSRSVHVLAYDPSPIDPARVGDAQLASPDEVFSQCETICLCLPSPTASLDVVQRIATTDPRRVDLIVEFSTIGPVAARQGHAAAATAGIRYLDAPVSGGVSSVASGDLSIMFAGAQDAVIASASLLSRLSKNTRCVGGTPGQGQIMKLLNNIVSATALAITSEAVLFGTRSGLDMDTIIDVLNISSGRTSASEKKFPQSIRTETFDYGASVETMFKDVHLYLSEATAAAIPREVATSTHSVWHGFLEDSPGRDLTYIYRYLERLTEPRPGDGEN